MHRSHPGRKHLPVGAGVACTIRGKTGGRRALCQGNKSYRTTYTFHGADQAAFTAELAVCRVFTTAKRTRRLKRRSEWMILILIHLDWSNRQARRQYRRRFGIEFELPLRGRGPWLDDVEESRLPLCADCGQFRSAERLGLFALAVHAGPAPRPTLA